MQAVYKNNFHMYKVLIFKALSNMDKLYSVQLAICSNLRMYSHIDL